jgi:hypothetical protein
VNIKVLTWLVRHRDLLVAVVKEAQAFKPDAPYIEQWNVVDKIARLVIPVLQAENVDPKAFWSYGNEDLGGTLRSLHDGDVEILAAGAEVQALGVDWKQLADVILPIVIAILEALLRR